MEQKAKKYEELNKYEKAMTNASLEQRLEAMVRDLMQIATALKISVTVDTTFHNWEENQFASGRVNFYNGVVTNREFNEEGDFFGVIEEALAKTKDSDAS